MPTKFAISLVGTHDHRQRVPTHDGGKALLDGQIPREDGLLSNRDRVDIRAIEVGMPAESHRVGGAHKLIK